MQQRYYWQTDKMLLRAFEPEDVERIIKNRNNLDSNLQWLYDEIKLPRTHEDLKADYTDMIKNWEKDDKCLLAIENKEGDFAGEITVWFTKRPEMYFIYGVHIEERYQKQGLAKEALKVLFDYYFNEIGYRKVEALVYGYNRASQIFHERLGFTLEGILRNRIYSRGQYHDTLVYGMLKDEFNSTYDHSAWRKAVK